MPDKVGEPVVDAATTPASIMTTPEPPAPPVPVPVAFEPPPPPLPRFVVPAVPAPAPAFAPAPPPPAPGLRYFDKEAVEIGGGKKHRLFTVNF